MQCILGIPPILQMQIMSNTPGIYLIQLMPNSSTLSATSNYDTFYVPGSLGKFGVSLVATSFGGCKDSINKKLFITEATLPHPDFFVMAPSLYCAPALETFINTTTNKQSTSGYVWDFGDGSSLVVSDTSPVSHVYDHFNTDLYSISLSAYTPHGCPQTIAKNAINITGPVPSFTMDNKAGCDSLTVHFTNTSKNVKKFYFLYGDGSPADSGSLVPHKYVLNDPNLDSVFFYPTLLSIGDSLCSDYFKDTIKIYRHCTSGITPDDNSQFGFAVYPNPFQSSVTVQYGLTNASKITLALFDITGRQVGTIINENHIPGAYQLNIDAEKYKIGQGVYILKFMAGSDVITRRLVKF